MPITSYTQVGVPILHLLRADLGTYSDLAHTTPVTADGSVIGYWADQSGNTASNGLGFRTTKWTLKTNQTAGGFPCIRAAGAGYYLFDIPHMLPISTSLAVVKIGATSTQTILSGTIHGIQYRTDQLSGSNARQRLVSEQVLLINGSTTALDTSSPAWIQLMIEYDNIANTCRFWTGQAGTADTNEQATATTQFCNNYIGIGRNMASASEYFSSDIAVLVGWMGKLTDAERLAVMDYTTTLTGVTHT